MTGSLLRLPPSINSEALVFFASRQQVRRKEEAAAMLRGGRRPIHNSDDEVWENFDETGTVGIPLSLLSGRTF